ncbi:MAG TPA: TlpA disulfide reductase family protein [Ignavibacteria bacterium]|nr:TlpA disulfide reductase family protein [Ignavibacteria bacterium]
MKKLILILFLVFPCLYLNSQTLVHLKTEADIDRVKDSLYGNIYLINLWATWCKPCTDEFPGLVQLYNEYKDKGFKIIFISVDETSDIENAVLPFLKNNNVDFTTYINDFKSSDDFMSHIDSKWDGSIPMTYIYDSRGNLYRRLLGGRDYDFFKNEIQGLYSGL